MNVYLGELYKEVEYIQSSGTQYIDTGLLVKPDTEVQIDMQLTSVAANVRYFAVETGNNNGWVAFVVYLDSNKQIAFANGNWSVLRTGRNGDTSRYTFVANNSSLKIYSNGTNVYTGNAIGTRTTNSANNLYLLANDSNGTANLFSSAKLYSCKMYESSTLVRDFIPCYRVSDNVIGLFDKVENKFYTNAGTGTFTKGSDVKVFQPMLKNAYIGEVWAPGSNTLLYLPFSDDLNDHSSNQTSTKGGTVSIATLDGVKCANFNSGYLTFPSKKWFGTNSTFSLWVKNPSNPQESSIFCTSGVAGGGTEYVFLWRINNSPQSITLGTYGGGTGNPGVSVNYSVPSGWTNIVATMEGLVAKLYINGQLGGQVTMYYNNVTASTLYIGNNTDEPSVSKWWLKAYLSELIIENTVWDATKVAHYYDITKGNYGL